MIRGFNHAMSRLPRLAIVVGLAELSATSAWAAGLDAITHGHYLCNAAGHASCHTVVEGKSPPLSGGRALKTPFVVTARLGESDLRAVVAYLRALTPIHHKVKSKKKGS